MSTILVPRQSMPGRLQPLITSPRKARSVPMAVIVCFILDFVMTGLDVAQRVAFKLHLITRDMNRSALFDLGDEANFPTWYSSSQLFVVGAIISVMAYLILRQHRPGALGLFVGAAMFLGLSLDECAQVHERLGDLFNTAKTNAHFTESGLWPFVCVPLFLVLLVMAYRTARTFLTRETFTLFAVGLAVLMLGAVGFEMLANLIQPRSGDYLLCMLTEETLEMIGATICLWASIRMAQYHGVKIRLAAPQTER